MIPGLVRLAVRRSLHDTLYVKVVPRRQAHGLVAEVYRQVEREFGMLAPPVALHSAAPDSLAASWLILRETLVAQGVTDRASKEAIATGVSEANNCPYCVDVHDMTLAAYTGAEGRSDPTALVAWARASASAQSAGAPPFLPEEAPELIGVAVAFQYYNRMANVFLRDSPFPAHVPETAKPQARRVLGGVLRRSADGSLSPGRSLHLLPAAEPPEDLAWARPNPVVTEAFARAYAATDAAGAASVPAAVRALVLDTLSTWDGLPPGLSRSWVDGPVATLPTAQRAVGRLTLLIALASYQVDQGIVDDFRRTAPEDGTLIEVASWASMAAARRISTWLHEETYGTPRRDSTP